MYVALELRALCKHCIVFTTRNLTNKLKYIYFPPQWSEGLISLQLSIRSWYNSQYHISDNYFFLPTTENDGTWEVPRVCKVFVNEWEFYGYSYQYLYRYSYRYSYQYGGFYDTSNKFPLFLYGDVQNIALSSPHTPQTLFSHAAARACPRMNSSSLYDSITTMVENDTELVAQQFF